MIKPVQIIFLISTLLCSALTPQNAAAKDPDLNWVLALSWGPAFCETVRHNRPECQNIKPDDLSGKQLVLHGLWPADENYCGVSDDLIRVDKARKWEELPALELTAETRASLNRNMPGTASYLHRHEWIKHGTCSGLTADDYYRLSLKLLEQSHDLPLIQEIIRSLGKHKSFGDLCRIISKDWGSKGIHATEIKTRKVGKNFLLTEFRFFLTTGNDGSLNLSIEDLRNNKNPVCDARTFRIDMPGQD